MLVSINRSFSHSSPTLSASHPPESRSSRSCGSAACSHQAGSPSLHRLLCACSSAGELLCTDQQTGENFACKSIPRNKWAGKDIVDNLKRELNIMAHLPEHANIVSLYDSFGDDHAEHLIMELCQGGELFDRIAARDRPRFTEAQAARAMRTIMEVVQTCHRHGVMHRDLKPENFLFVDESEDSPLKVIDFGLSVFFEPGERFYDVVGTHVYMAPEIWEGRGYGPQVDVWSAGVILYVMLSQQYPFKGVTSRDISRETLHGRLNLERHPWRMVSESAKSLLRHMLDRDPEARYTPEEVLNHPWLQDERVEDQKCEGRDAQITHDQRKNLESHCLEM